MDFIKDLKRISFECFQKVDFITSDSINIKLKYVLNDFLANYPQRKYSEKVQSIFIMPFLKVPIQFLFFTNFDRQKWG